MKRIIQRTSKDHPLYDASLGGYVVAVCTPTGDITRLSGVLHQHGFTLEIGPENVECPTCHGAAGVFRPNGSVVGVCADCEGMGTVPPENVEEPK